MKSVALMFVVAATAALSSPTLADQPRQSEIPPNCTLDPWTGKLNCHIWPTCTLDPFTGKMTCRVPVTGAPIREAGAF
jgi:hypothetical protein